jgi:hypothetical protein
MAMDIRYSIRVTRALVGGALALGLVAGGALAGPKKLPHRFDWTRFQPAGNKSITPAERTRIALAGIREEVVNPTTHAYWDPAGDHYPMLWTMVAFLTHPNNEAGMDRKLIRDARAGSRNPEERDVLLLLLGNLGDAGVKGEVTSYLLDAGKPGRLRMLAATALGEIRDPASIDILLRVAETDRATERRPRGSGTDSRKSMQSVYLVREAARTALVRFDQDLLLSEEARARLKAIKVAED